RKRAMEVWGVLRPDGLGPATTVPHNHVRIRRRTRLARGGFHAVETTRGHMDELGVRRTFADGNGRHGVNRATLPTRRVYHAAKGFPAVWRGVGLWRWGILGPVKYRR